MPVLKRLLTAPARRPVRTLLIALAVVLLAAISASRLRPTTSLEDMFPRDRPAVDALHRLLDDFAAAEELLLWVHAADDDPRADDPRAEDVSADLLSFARRLEAELEQDPVTARSVATVTYRSGADSRRFVEEVVRPAIVYYLDDRGLEALESRLSPAGIRAQVARNESLLATPSLAADAVARQILRDPLRLFELLQEALAPVRDDLGGRGRGGAFLSPDGRGLLIRITGTRPASAIAFTRQLMPAIRQAIERAEPGELIVESTGAYAFAELSDREIRKDMTLSLGGSAVLLVVLFLVAYRSPVILAPALAPVVVGIVVGFGTFALLASRFTPITAVVGAILAGLSVDYAVHYLAHLAAERGQGTSLAEATDIQHGPGRALIAALVTSLVAFTVIAASSIAALREFALVGTFGLIAAFLATVTVTPALVALLDRRTGRRSALTARFDPATAVRWIARHRRACLTVGLAVLVAASAIVLLPGHSLITTELALMQPRPNPPLDTQAEIARQFGASPDSLIILLRAESESALVDLSHEVSTRLRSIPVRAARGAENELSTLGLSSALPSTDRIERGLEAARAIDAERVIADFRSVLEDSIFEIDAFADYEAYLRRALAPPPPPTVADLASVPSLAGAILPHDAFDASATRDGPVQALTLISLGRSLEDRADRDAIIATVRQALDDLDGATLTGLKVLNADLQTTVMRDLVRLLIAASLIVVVWLLIVFRRPARVLLALVPAVFGLVVLLAVLKWTGVGFNTMNLVALPLIAGLGVDDGIFLVSSFARSGRRRLPLEEDLGASSHAITMTSVTTTIAFGSLTLTSTPAIASLGLVVAVGIAGAWFASLFVLTPMLLAFETTSTRASAS